MPGWDGQLGDIPYKLDFPPQGEEGGTSASGTWTFQNSSPSDLRFQNSEPGFGDTAAYSARTYANQSGSIGKQNEIQAPADLQRPFQCELDNSRPGYLAPRLLWERGATILYGNTSVNMTGVGAPLAPADTSRYGLGHIALTTGGAEAGHWLFTYDQASGTMQPRVQVNVPSISVPRINAAPYNAQMRSVMGRATIRETCGQIYVPHPSGGAVNITRAFGSQTPVHSETLFWHFVSFGGYIFSFEQTDKTGVNPGMTISLRKTPATPGDATELDVLKPTTLSGIDAAPELGNADIQEPVPDVICCWTPVVYGGAIYACTDRQVLKIIYDDENARILVVPIHTSFTRITGNPEIYQGSLFVPSGNIVYKWTPGQLEFTPVPVDNFGDLPESRGGGTVMALRAVANGMAVGMQAIPGQTADSTLLMMDVNMTFEMIHTQGTGAAVSQVAPFLTHFVDINSSGSSVGFIHGVSGLTKPVIAVREAARDPIYYVAAKRKQVSGSHWWMSPVDFGVNYGDPKQGLRVAAACTDVTAGALIRIYYQVDYEGRLPDEIPGFLPAAIPGTLMEGMGKWHLALTLNGSDVDGKPQLVGTHTVNDGGTIKQVYAGYAAHSMVGEQITYRAIRWAVEIIGDPNGLVYPRLAGFKHYYSETPAIYVVHSLRVRILANDPDLAGSPRTGAFPPPQDADDVYLHFSKFYEYARKGTFVTFVDPNGGHREGKITKIILNGVSLIDTPDGLPQWGRHRYDRMILQLAVQEAESADWAA